jgi:GAF domain-containing protein
VFSEARKQEREDIAGQLQDLVLDSVDVSEFLNELAVFSGDYFSGPVNKVRCAFTLLRQKKPATVASSDAYARELDEIQLQFAEGPCLSAMYEDSTIHVPDVRTEMRWPEYMDAVAKCGVGSILAVPLELEGESRAALNLFSLSPHGFSGDDIEGAEEYAGQAARAMRLALRIARLTDARNNLTAAMQSRTVIDIATGVVMAQNRCSQEAALQILKSASSTRNIKLRDIALSIAASVSADAGLSTHFEE